MRGQGYLLDGNVDRQPRKHIPSPVRARGKTLVDNVVYAQEVVRGEGHDGLGKIRDVRRCPDLVGHEPKRATPGQRVLRSGGYPRREVWLCRPEQPRRPDNAQPLVAAEGLDRAFLAKQLGTSVWIRWADGILRAIGPFVDSRSVEDLVRGHDDERGR